MQLIIRIASLYLNILDHFYCWAAIVMNGNGKWNGRNSSVKYQANNTEYISMFNDNLLVHSHNFIVLFRSKQLPFLLKIFKKIYSWKKGSVFVFKMKFKHTSICMILLVEDLVKLCVIIRIFYYELIANLIFINS